MKLLLILLIAAACGKHEMPLEKDLGDSDGDQIPNAFESSEFDKLIANVTPIGKVQAQLNFRQGKGVVVDSTIELENNVNFSVFAKDMLVKSLEFLPVDDYFSQYSLLKVKHNKAPLHLTQNLIPVRLIIEGPDQLLNLSLVSKTKSEVLGTFSKTIALEFPKETLEKILLGEVVLAVSKVQDSHLAPLLQDVTVKSKTYRVLYDDGAQTKIFYVSKSLSFENFLQSLKIEKYHLIDEVDLLSTNHTHRMPVWWLRNINDQDKVLIHSDVRALSDHYLQGMKFQAGTAARKDGTATQGFSLLKDSRAKGLVKIRSTQSQNHFREHSETTKHFNGRPADGGYRYSCNWYHRNFTHETPVPVPETVLRASLGILANDLAVRDYDLVSGEDEKGPFWELKISEGVTKIDFYLHSLPASTFTQVGMYTRVCGGPEGPLSQSTPKNLEGQLSFFFETYVEKI